MERKSLKELLRNPAFLWMFGIGCGFLVILYLLPPAESGFFNWMKPVCWAGGIGFLLYSFAHIIKWNA